MAKQPKRIDSSLFVDELKAKIDRQFEDELLAEKPESKPEVKKAPAKKKSAAKRKAAAKKK